MHITIYINALALTLQLLWYRKNTFPKGRRKISINKYEKKMKLEAKVLDYIIHHENGVRISEMETPLRESRMKLGFVTKSLLEEGKIIKVNNEYFPKNKIKQGGSELSLGP